jgi:hypothetical protein
MSRKGRCGKGKEGRKRCRTKRRKIRKRQNKE